MNVKGECGEGARPTESQSLSAYDQVKLELADIVRFAGAKAPRESGFLPRTYMDFFARLADDRFNLALMGRFNRGKTSLMNAMMGLDRLPTGLVPLTSVITSVSYGSTERVDLEFERGGLPIEIRMSDLADQITERGNPGNRRGIREARIRLPAEILRRGYYFVDTPGLGSAIVDNTRTSLNFLPETDALVLVSSYESPLSEEEMRVLETMARSRIQVFLILNKQDALPPAARQEVLAFVKRELERLYGAEHAPAVFSTSATLALQAKLEGHRDRLEETGLPALEEALTRYLLAHKNTQFLNRMIAQARALLEALPDEESIRALKGRLEQIEVAHGSSRAHEVGTSRTEAVATAASVQRCELCEGINDHFFEFLCHFQHAVVTDAQERERFITARGFCVRHFWLYAALAAPRDMCVALAPLLKEISAKLSESSGPSIPAAPICQLCAIQEKLESQAVAKIAAESPGPDSTLANAPSLCIPHLRLIAARLEDPLLARALCAEHARGFARLAEDMQRYALKHDALRRYLTSEDERRASEDAMHRVAGRRLINP